MSDLKLTLGLDDSRFTRGLNKVEQDSRGVARRVESNWRDAANGIDRSWRTASRAIDGAFRLTRTGALAATAAIGAGALAMRQYGREFDFARDSLDGLNRSGAEFVRIVGRELSNSQLPDLLNTIGERATEAADKLARMARVAATAVVSAGSPSGVGSIVAGVATEAGRAGTTALEMLQFGPGVALGGIAQRQAPRVSGIVSRASEDVSALRRAIAEAEALDRATRQRAAADAIGSGFRTTIARAEGRDREALELSEGVRLRDTLADLNRRQAAGEINPAQLGELSAQARAARDAALVEFDRRAAEQAAREADRLRVERDRRDARLDELRLDRESLGIDRLRLQGREREAELAENALSLRRALAVIERDPLLDARGKAQAQAIARQRAGLRAEALGLDNPTRAQAIDPGISPAIAVAALGVGLAQRQASDVRTIASVVTKIESKIARGSGVF